MKIHLTNADAREASLELEGSLVFETLDGAETMHRCDPNAVYSEMRAHLDRLLAAGWTIAEADEVDLERLGKGAASEAQTLTIPDELRELAGLAPATIEGRLTAAVRGLPHVHPAALAHLSGAREELRDDLELHDYRPSALLTAHRVGAVDRADHLLPFLEVGRVGAQTLYLDLLNGTLFAFHADDWVSTIDPAKPLVAQIAALARGAGDRGALAKS